MNVYLVKEVQYEWVNIIKVFKSEKKAEELCRKLWQDKNQTPHSSHILNYAVEIHILED